MLKAYLKTAIAVDCPNAVLCHGRLSNGVRSVSTNSAIARGIRRSSPASYRAQDAQSRGTPEKPVFRTRHDENSISGFGRENTERIRRPNHQQKQDVEDMEQSSLQKKERLSPRRKRYLQGGRTNGEPRRYDGRDLSGSSTLKNFEYRRSDRKDRDPGAERRRTSDSSDTKHKSGRTFASYHNDDRVESGDRYSSRDDKSYRPSVQSKDRTERTEHNASREKPLFRTHMSDNQEASFIYRAKISSNRADSTYSSSENSDRRNASSSYQSYEASRRSSTPESSRYGDASDKPKNRSELRALKFGSASSENNDPVSRPQSEADDGPLPPYSQQRHDSDFAPKESELPISNLPKDGPISIPYTTPASEFLYGTSVVLAALASPLRKLYKLYIYAGTHREAADADARTEKLAIRRNVPIVRVQHAFLRLMDKMSGGRPHNGYILEASPLPKLPAASLLPVSHTNAPLALALDHQSREDAAINGTDPNIHYGSPFPRYPLLIFLDGILDPGNLGAILRSAHFLGVDAVALSARHSAPLTPVALKASAGAAESLPLISIRTPAAFVDASRAAGWKFYAAVAPTDQPGASADSLGAEKESPVPPVPHYKLPTLAALCPTRAHPCVLMLGGEGEGLRWALRRKADATVSIETSRRAGGVDSLNVSVAAGLLCEAFLRAPSEAAVVKEKTPNRRSGGGVERVDKAVLWKPSARGRKPSAGGRKPRAEVRKPRAEVRKLRAEVRKRKAERALF
ncbi:hypothetical protein MMC17_008785 [Xylographa soralifera]|nr:hypothetical protein [Xylographa soralifera]